ncbi:Single-stranded-DNA-specific exonuclease RecJ [hydrothermal vent metagenome]|uniref:Single-stranded-DNA-specific exonuclease RecJ n=1 Tax=hydrothermal vent metagenome TaxID=652676 RepID=A0A3B1B7J3_9ZZZZ
MVGIIQNQVINGECTLSETMHPVLRRVFAARGIKTEADLSLGLDRLLPVTQLTGANEAAALLHQMLERQRRILVVGDFDTDGATSCALAVRALKMMGAQDVRYLVPNRFEFGYGLTPAIVAEALKQAPDLLVTVDNGISSVEGVAAANAAGVPVLVTDHHIAGDQLPDAAVLVNPQLPEDTFPSKHLAGVGVIFYVMLALRRYLREAGWFESQGMKVPNLASLLDLVALGTVADVVRLDHNNRIMVHQGLQRIRAGKGCAGINAIIEVAKRSQSGLVTADLGFAIAPRLNAAGRLDDMSLGIECLLADDMQTARAIAQQLDELNHTRRQIEGEMVGQAMDGLSDLLAQEDSDLAVGLCIFRQEWHQGVIGILASRIREHFHRPVIAFAPAQEGVLKGSARSVPGLNIRDVLADMDARNPGLMERFGGHAMAAGLTLQEQHFELFSQAFDQEVQRHLGCEDLFDVFHSDGVLAVDELNLGLAELIREVSPWGQGFPEPKFDGVFCIRSKRIVGGRHLKLTVSPEGADLSLDAIAFNQTDDLADGDRVSIGYRLDVNQYRSRRSVQMVVEHIQAQGVECGQEPCV